MVVDTFFENRRLDSVLDKAEIIMIRFLLLLV